MSSLSFTGALGCLFAAIAVGTATGQSAPDAATGEPAPDAASACAPCSVHMLRGLYLWTFDGYSKIGGKLVPKALLEGIRFNGDGTEISQFGTLNFGGTTIIDATGGVGTYTVAPDCTGTLSHPGGASFNMYVGPGAQKIWITQIQGDGITGVGVGTATRLPGR
jgi:hypothetical protein